MDTNIKKIFKHLFISHLLLNITNCLCGIARGYIAGNLLDSIALSCDSIITPYNTIIIGFATIHSSSSEILCGKYMGVGDKKSINKTFTNAIVITLIFGLITTISSLIFTKPLLTLLGASLEIMDACESFFRAFVLGIIPIMIMPVLVSFLHMENEGKHITISVILLAALYALFGFFFIKVLDLSYFGFGLTNTMSQLVTVLFLLIKIVKNKKQVNFDIKELDIKFIGNMYSLGFSGGVAGMYIGLRNIILNKTIMLTGGVIYLAAHSVVVSSVCIMDCIVTSVLQTYIMISSICVGEKNIDELASLIKHLFLKVWPIYLLVLTIQIIFIRFNCSFFTNDMEVYTIASKLSRFYLLSTILEIISDSLISIYTVLEHKKFANLYNFLHCFLIHSLFAITFKSILNVYAIYLGYIATEITCFIILYIFVVYKQKRAPHSFKDLIVTKENYDDVLKYSITITDKKEVINISENLSDFCLTNDIDSRRSKLTGLFIEEMVMNIFDHGYTKKQVNDKKVDIFLLIEKENITVRIRDNSIPFDPTTRSIIFNPEDPCKNIGLRMVSKLSKEMTYQNFFGYNNMIIRI